tara:strand:+ start:1252 stop:1431 length:180 start_codon:yes stop_codon:yes gene_type:complete
LCLGFWAGFFVLLFGDTHYQLLPLVSAAVSWTADNFNNSLHAWEDLVDNKIKREKENAK